MQKIIVKYNNVGEMYNLQPVCVLPLQIQCPIAEFSPIEYIQHNIYRTHFSVSLENIISKYNILVLRNLCPICNQALESRSLNELFLFPQYEKTTSHILLKMNHIIGFKMREERGRKCSIV